MQLPATSTVPRGPAKQVGKRVAVYARVSTTDQTCDAHLHDLREYVAARGWQATEFIDQGVSGAKERRPALDRLMAEVKARRIDVVVVAAFDRFGRSTRHLVETLELFRHLGVEFVSLRESIDTGSPLGQAVCVIIAAIAQLEGSLITERVKAGLRRARAEETRLGRPPLRVDPCEFERVTRLKVSVRGAAKMLGVSPLSYLRLPRTRRDAPGGDNGRLSLPPRWA